MYKLCVIIVAYQPVIYIYSTSYNILMLSNSSDSSVVIDEELCFIRINIAFNHNDNSGLIEYE